ncbi:hypothetical protein LUZ60_015133 [Juncus effusus]|nr:hypothetical protein LUZ60_015133 [Juncus effusus]
MAEIFELSNGVITLKVSNWGATITSLLVPDSKGNVADVVLGFDNIDPYMRGEAPYFGCIVGRVANRIKNGKFTLDGVEYSLPINQPPHSLHGGFKGYDKVLWEVTGQTKGEKPSITFKYHSKDGEEGYPGDVIITAEYSLPSSKSLILEMSGLPQSKPTPISLAQHTYWNLAGHGSGSVLNHSIQILARHVTPVDPTLIPTGEVVPVEGTPFDFLSETLIGARMDQVQGEGYDHNYVLDCDEPRDDLKKAVRLKDPLTGRVLELWTDAKGMQFYTGNYVSGIKGKEGKAYEKHGGVCLETQGFPNAVNEGKFPSVVVRPGEKYKHTMLFEFSNE